MAYSPLDCRLATRVLSTILFILFYGLCYAQNVKGLSPINDKEEVEAGITKAVIVGISDYQNENITDLQYADKDAKIYAEYLMSPAGGGVDSNNITLLLNEEATSGNFVAALYGLMEECKEGDQVIIYFSGHGDVESTTLNQPGFLLCWDSPAKVYMGGGTFGLNYLQDIISTLSLQSKAKVVVITDACRSGKLAGNGVGGAHATAANLSKQFANEIKILSCQPNEFALESKSWGGGRGVFSYHFVRGIQGLADRNNDGFVSLSEIDRYLEDQVSISVAPHQQLPLTVGSKTTIISTVDPEALQKLIDEKEKKELAPVEGKAGVLFDIIEGDTFILTRYQDFKNAIESNHLLYPAEESAWAIFEEIMDNPSLKAVQGLMRRNLAAALQDDAQQAINEYLSANPVELQKRWSFSNVYDKFPESLEKAAQLLGPDHFFYKVLKARAYYFNGLLLRLEGEKTGNEALYRKAMLMQDSCLSLEPNAPFALNDKGLIYRRLNEPEKSIIQYKLALKLTPEWPLLWSNMCLAYGVLGESDEAIKCGIKSYNIDSNFVLGMFNTGNEFRRVGREEEAMDIYHRGLIVNPKDPDINQALGFMHLENGDYEKAISFFLVAVEMSPNNVSALTSLGHAYLSNGDFDDAKGIFFRAKPADPESEQAFQGIIEYYYGTNDLVNADIQLREYVDLYPTDSFSHYLISSIAASQGNKSKCLEYLELAFKKGFNQLDVLESDANFINISKCRKYKNLLKKYDLK